MSIGVNEFLRAIKEQNVWLQGERRRVDELKTTHVQQRREYEAGANKAWNALTAALIPALDGGRLDAVAAMVRLEGVSSAGAAAAKAKLVAYLESKIGAIVAEHPPAQSESRLNALEIRISELEREMAPLQEPIESLERAEHFMELITSKYGTEDYGVPFWKYTYYKHWKHGDLALEEHGAAWKVEDFGQLRAKYLDQRVALDTFVSEHVEVSRARQDIQSAGQDLVRWRAQLAKVDATVVEQLRGKVREHLEMLEVDDVLQLLAKDPTSALVAKRLAGLKKKREYLDAFYDRYIAGMDRDIAKMMAKNQKHAVKYFRPKHRYTQWKPAEFNRRFGDRRSKWDQRYSRYERARDRMWGWDDYDRYDPYDDRPWFIYFDDGSLKGRFLEDVSAYKSERGKHDHIEAAAARDLAEPDDGLVEDWS